VFAIQRGFDQLFDFDTTRDLSALSECGGGDLLANEDFMIFLYELSLIEEGVSLSYFRGLACRYWRDFSCDSGLLRSFLCRLWLAF
jgi:hypothetical protein